MTRRALLTAFALLPATGKSGDTCTGQLIASGRLSSADHESIDGWYAVNECAIHVHPDGIPAQILRDLRDQPVEIVIRRVERQLDKVDRAQAE